MNTLVSIIIPAYNRKKVIARAIESCLNQTYQNIEVVVCDDHSTDKTLEYVKEKYLGNKKIICCQTPLGKKGPSAARNEAIKRSRGDVLVFLDSDDYLVEDSLKLRLATMNENKCGFVYGDVCVKSGTRMVLNEYDSLSAMEQKQYLMEEMSLCTTDSIMVKRSIALEIGGFDENLPAWEDDDFVIKVGMRERLVHCGGIVAIMYPSKNSQSVDYSYRYIGCKELIRKNKEDIIGYASYRRYLIWRVREISLWMKARAQKQSSLSKKMIYEWIGMFMDKVIRKYFRHIYA